MKDIVQQVDDLYAAWYFHKRVAIEAGRNSFDMKKGKQAAFAAEAAREKAKALVAKLAKGNK